MQDYDQNQFSQTFLKVRAIINEIDPFGLIEWCGEEEYDSEVKDIVARLKSCHSADEVSKMVIAVFTHWFDDPGDIEQYAGVGAKIFVLKSALL